MRLVILLLLSGVALCVAATPPKAFPYPYDQHDFPNGLRLITVPTDYPNVVSLYIVVQTGSRNEVEPGKSGFAHLFEHMMFRGTKAYPTAKYEAVLKETGAASNAYTTDDHTAYHTTFSKEDFETILSMEADRFQNLDYTEAAFRTETLAVLGEYNKNSASPAYKLHEVLHDTAFDKHTYKHTTMGFLKDIQDMPNQYAYSRQFFDRYYRPEYTTIIVAGDIRQDQARTLVEKYWGHWKRGSFRPDIPAEPPPTGARSNQINWPTPTLPWLVVAFRGSAYSDTEGDQATLDVISFLGFSPSSELYQKLVIEEQKVDTLQADNPDHVDPGLFSVYARVKKAEDIDAVRQAIAAAFERFKKAPVAKDRLEAVKSHLRYQFALGMDNSEAIAAILARYVALRRTPETINKLYDLYSQVTPEDVQKIANKYFVDQGQTTVTLKGGTAITPLAQQDDAPGQVFRATVNVVVAPVTVTDRDGNYVSDLKPSDFRLLDNERLQDIKVDTSYVPISLAVVIQANWDMEAVLPKLQKIGSLFQGLVTGEQGEVAVLAFDHRIQVLQDFTTDADLISQALTKLKRGSTTSAMIDANSTAIRMLARRPGNRRRIILYIGETRDRGSEGKVRDALILAQLNNVLFYPVSVNRLVTTLTAKPMPPRPDPFPPGARPLPAGVPPTPENTRQTVAGASNSASFIPVFVEIFKQVKAIFVDNPVEVFTEYTGGREYSFITQRDLERAITSIGQELHSQYLISYSPNNKIEGGFHDIRVELLDRTGRLRRDLKVRSRPGYWMAAVPD